MYVDFSISAFLSSSLAYISFLFVVILGSFQSRGRGETGGGGSWENLNSGDTHENGMQQFFWMCW